MRTSLRNIKTIYKGTPGLIEVKKYYDLHGAEIDEGKYAFNVGNATVELKEQIRTYYWSNTEKEQVKEWNLFINGEKKNLGEIVFIDELKSKLKLTSCVGSG